MLGGFTYTTGVPSTIPDEVLVKNGTLGDPVDLKLTSTR